MYELAAPLGKAEDYKEILKKTLDHNTMIKQYSDKKAIQRSIDQKQADEFTINDPTVKINNNIEQLFDKIPEEQQAKLNEVWKTKYKNL